MSARSSVRPFFDPSTATVSYVIADAASRRAAVIDPVLDYDFKSGHTDTRAVDAVLAYLRGENLSVQWILETHAHADHLSGARHLQEQVVHELVHVDAGAAGTCLDRVGRRRLVVRRVGHLEHEAVALDQVAAEPVAELRIGLGLEQARPERRIAAR